MPLATLDSTHSRRIRAKELTPDAFAPYGFVISTKEQLKTHKIQSANYGTAQKIFQINPVIDNFSKCPSGKPSRTNLNMFRCSPPNHLLTYDADRVAGRVHYLSKVVERHPFSTQTFMPMGRPRSEIAYLIIVAKNRPDGLPDLDNVEAFVARGDQAVTYGAGTWHAPMVALGDVVDFGVLINENGQSDEDCQETYINPGLVVEFDLPVSSKL